MLDIIQSVFREYTRLRLNGLDAPEAVRALYPHLEEFDKNMRDELARNIRAWENQRTVKITFEEREILAKASQEADETLKCLNCGKANSARERICYSCGALLTPLHPQATDILPPQSDDLAIDDACFRKGYVLLLMPESDNKPFSLRPQLSGHGLTLGRVGHEEGDVDVNLERVGAGKNGVSRIHAVIEYDKTSETLSLIDAGSTNGSFINGQKLHADERRTLRHGDKLQLGRLGFQVIYKEDGR